MFQEPVGTVKQLSTAWSVPYGWIALKGQTICRCDYPFIFRVIEKIVNDLIYWKLDGDLITVPNFSDRFLNTIIKYKEPYDVKN